MFLKKTNVIFVGLLSSPFRFADHKGRHLLGLGFAIGLTGAASVTGVPADVEQLDSQRQLVFF